jgi:hypothetical protein
LREQTIYVPFGRMREVFEKEGRGVFLPYEKFQELWQQARSKHAPTAAERPPVGVLLTEADNQATVEKDVVVVKSRIQLEVLGKGWHEVPLRLQDAALRAAQLDNEPAKIVFDAERGHRLLVHQATAEPRQLVLSLEYAKAFTKSPGQNSVSFAAPQVPVNRWQIRIPQPGVKVNVHPMIAATEMNATAPPPPAPAPTEPGAAAAPPPVAPAETVLLAFVGAAPEVRIDWTPKAEGAAGMEALTSVQAEQEVTIEEGVVRTRARLVYEITRAEVSQLAVEVPADHKVTGVFDPNVRQWVVATEQNKQTIRIQLFEATRGAQNIALELERFADVFGQEVSVPVVGAVGAGRQQGIVVVRLGEELQAEVTRRNGLLQLDKGELSTSLQQSNWLFAYRYATLPFDLALKIQKVEPQIRTTELTEIYLTPDQLTYDLIALLDIQRAGVFQVEVRIPGDCQVRQVRGHACAGAEAVQVDSHHVDAADPTRLKVNLAKKATGRVALLVELDKTLSDPNLTSPTGTASEIGITVPRIANRVEQTTGHLIVYGPEALRVNPQKKAGLHNVSFAEAQQPLPTMREGRFPDVREVLAFAYSQSPVELSLNVERRNPQISVRQLLAVRIDAGVARYDATFHYDVQFSPVKTLRIDIPSSLTKDKVHNVTASVRDEPLNPQPAGLAETGYVAWVFTRNEGDFFGNATIQLWWEDRQSDLAVGQSAEYSMPVLRPADVDRAWGQVVLAKAETLDIQPKSGYTQVRPIDPQHDLMSGASVPDAARAFEFHDPQWTLVVTATRYALEEVRHTSIDRALLRMVVTLSDSVSVQALYRMRSAAQRLVLQVPDKATFDTDPLRINGRAVPLEHGDEKELFVPLVNQASDTPFLLELRYTVPSDRRRFAFPVFVGAADGQGRPAMQKVYVSLFLPEEMTLLGSQSASWTSEQHSWLRRHILRQSEPTSDTGQIEWVIEGLSLPSRPESTFATDGALYVFSSLQPKDPPAGSLQLVTMPRRWLHAVVFASLVAIALLFVRTSPFTKLFALTTIAIALLLAGVFAPTFTAQVVDGGFFAALAAVVLVWVVSMAVPRREPGLGSGLPPAEFEPTVAHPIEPEAAHDHELPKEAPPGEPTAASEGGPDHV